MRGRNILAGLLLVAMSAGSIAGDGTQVTGFKLDRFRAGRSASEEPQLIEAKRIKLPARIVAEDDRGIVEIVDAAQLHWWVAKRNTKTDAVGDEKKGPCVNVRGHGERGIQQC